MEKSKGSIISYFKSLPPKEQEDLLEELMGQSSIEISCEVLHTRCKQLEDKQGKCPHCGSIKYVKNGKSNGVQRYRCKNCQKYFTEYSGTWLAGLHKKELVNEYLELFHAERSLDKIKDQLDMCKQTAFDWRHKILSSFGGVEKGDFKGLTESDETFLPFSEKGARALGREPRKRGGKAGKRGISNQKAAIIVTADRDKQLEMTLATMGRIKKVDIEKSIGTRISEKTVLCTDSHVSYKGFAKDNSLEHHPIRADLKQHVKQGKFHVQHVNSLHNRLKKWINEKFWGVSTKYLQQYLNWFKVKEKIKKSAKPISDLAGLTVADTDTIYRFSKIQADFDILKKSA